jgi:sugar phosphate isomerase/epimerase
VTERRFGISTHLFHSERLTREHLVHIAAHGFEAIEVFATRSHFDYTDARAIDALAEWLSDTRLELHALHAPAFEGLRDNAWINPYSIASSSEERRRLAVAQSRAALSVADRIPYRYLVTHVGIPDPFASNGDNSPEAARRSITEICEDASGRRVGIAVEVMPNRLSTAEALVTLLEDDLDGVEAGICLDYGHAHLMGDLGDAIETLSGHLWTTHVHDNRGTRDDHLVPYAGSIDWDAAIMETQKIGYEGVLMFEVAGGGDPLDVLRRTAKARERLEQAFVTF